MLNVPILVIWCTLSIIGGNMRKMPKVKLGIDVLLEEKLNLIRGKRIGLIANQTSVNSKLQSTIDLLYQHPDVELIALFAPEHGIRGELPAGAKVRDYIDEVTGLPVYSLYGDRMKPTREMLENIDILIFDIQDVGSRAYTYVYTMELAMEAAHDVGIEFMVLDRPNPLGGVNVEGTLPEIRDDRFPAYNVLPIVHGMTIGELALYFNDVLNIGVKLIVIPMKGWSRDMLWEDTGLEWVSTSPHIPTPDAALCYAGMGLLGEIKNLSEGVGYTKPFEIVGAPWIDATSLADELNSRNLPGVYFRPIYYKPFYFRYVGEVCEGVELHLTDKHAFKPVATAIHILEAINELYPGRLDFEHSPGFNWAVGGTCLVDAIMAGKSASEILKESYALPEARDRLATFMRLRERYLLY
ncbi:hypothetical protein CGW93_01805 [candidate division bacterium WOR-3 4484_18]|uniref:DUF1343 domain-containing protein n=1 Tax=candidate division WOR-3 bacterium 4484_18 TaxID=2020626 RepID=A0A257LWA3_UNCW3|nr:MAG: hypothetical protein CGW93_01805 [candidate division bacterium WOR-3 4484_18]